MTAMGATALSSFWLRALHGADGTPWLSGFSWIHLLSIVTLCSLAFSLRALRRGRYRSHAGWAGGAYTGLVVAGAFTLSPHRIIGGWLFGGP